MLLPSSPEARALSQTLGDVHRGPAILLLLVLVLRDVGSVFLDRRLRTRAGRRGTPGQGPWLERVRASGGWLGGLATLVCTLGRRRGHRRAHSRDVALRSGGRDFWRVREALAGCLSATSSALPGCYLVGSGRSASACWPSASTGHSSAAIAGCSNSAASAFVLLLRLNPLTTSDLVSYAAGVRRRGSRGRSRFGTLFRPRPVVLLQALLRRTSVRGGCRPLPNRRRDDADNPPGPSWPSAPAAAGTLNRDSPGDAQRERPRGHSTVTVPGTLDVRVPAV